MRKRSLSLSRIASAPEAEREGVRVALAAVQQQRQRAAKAAGLAKIPAIMRGGEDALEVTIIENAQRENLNPLASLRTPRVYREIVEPERLVCAWAWEDAEGKPGHETLLTVTSAEHGAKTKLTLHHAVFESVTARDAH